MVEKERIVVISDPHLITKADRDQKKKKETPFGEKLFLRFFNHDKDEIHQQYLWEIAQKVGELGKADGSVNWLFDLGDDTFGSFNRGLISEEAVRERLEFNEIVNSAFPRMEKKYVWGNHDVGFQDTFSKILNGGLWNKGISKQSFMVAEKFIGPSFDLFKIKNFNFLILNSEIIRAVKTIGFIDYAERIFFLGKEREQRIFIEESFENEKGSFILLIHDPTQLKFIWPVLEEYADRICLTLAGHSHYVTYGRMLKKRSRIYRELKLEVIPSPWPCGGKIAEKITDRNGGGFAVLEISDSSFKLNRYWLSKPDLNKSGNFFAEMKITLTFL